MKKPSAGENKGKWRLLPGQLSADAENQLKEWTHIFDRQ
jgi:hypothetical protein